MYTKIDPINFSSPKIVPKAWGCEIWYANNSLYCLKKLIFKNGGEFSFHYHADKQESWVCSKGHLVLYYYDLSNADLIRKDIYPSSDTIHIPSGNPHKLVSIGDSEIWEVSTTHFDEDSYRIGKGDSQG